MIGRIAFVVMLVAVCFGAAFAFAYGLAREDWRMEQQEQRNPTITLGP